MATVGGTIRCRLLLAIVIGLLCSRVVVADAREAPTAKEPEGLSAVGPPLTALNTKIADPNWLVAWLLKPSQLRPGTIMPDFDLTTEEALALARNLYAGDAAPMASVKWQGGDSRTGEQLFVSRGCRGCHAISAAEPTISPRVPNLAGVGLKVRGDWLFNWLKSPHSYNAHTAMPQLALSDEEIRHLVAFLLTRKDGAAVVVAAPRFNPAAKPAGRTSLEQYECAKCHELKDFPPPEPAFELAVEGAQGSADTVLRNGRLLVAYYNCRGCHRIEGSGGAILEHLERKTFAPPTLEGEGKRVQTSWLTQFLQHPTSLRPWLEMHMPNFGFSEAQATALAKYFAVLAGVAATDEPLPSASDEIVTRRLRRIAHFKCVQCHPTNTDRKLPESVDPENLSINLTLAKTRLRPSWIRDFLTHPKAIVGTQTRMPTVFYTVDGSPKVEHPDQDIEAIAAYLLHMTESPEAALARLEAERKRENSQQTDWTTYTY